MPLPRSERAPATGSHVEGELRLDAETVIPVKGQVIRHVGREIAVALDPPGLTPEVLALLRRRYFPEGELCHPDGCHPERSEGATCPSAA